jgi:hypothetical protein
LARRARAQHRKVRKSEGETLPPRFLIDPFGA